MQNVIFPSLHAGQKYVLANKKQHNVLICARRWRKTTLMMRLAVMALGYGKQVTWAANTNEQCYEGFLECQKALGANNAEVIFKNSPSYRITRKDKQGVIRFISLEKAENKRGTTADLVIVDECQDVDAGKWETVLEPTLLGREGRESWLVGSPKGMNWFAAEYYRALDDPDSAGYNAPTVGARITEDGDLVREPHPLENSDISFSEIYKLFGKKSRRAFREEYLGEILNAEGSVFGDIGHIIDKGRSKNEPSEEGKVYSIGFDIGRSDDASVISVLDDLGKQVAIDVMDTVPFEAQLQRVEHFAALYPGRIYVDKTGIGNMPFEELKRRCPQAIAVHFGSHNKETIIENLKIAIEQSKVRLMDHPVQTPELLAYEYREETATGHRRMSAPRGQHDDTVIALALAAWGAVRTVRRRKKVVPSRSMNNPFIRRR